MGLDYDAPQDLGRVKMTMSKPSASVETLKYTLTDEGGGKANPPVGLGRSHRVRGSEGWT